MGLLGGHQWEGSRADTSRGPLKERHWTLPTSQPWKGPRVNWTRGGWAQGPDSRVRRMRQAGWGSEFPWRAPASPARTADCGPHRAPLFLTTAGHRGGACGRGAAGLEACGVVRTCDVHCAVQPGRCGAAPQPAPPGGSQSLCGRGQRAGDAPGCSLPLLGLSTLTGSGRPWLGCLSLTPVCPRRQLEHAGLGRL